MEGESTFTLLIGRVRAMRRPDPDIEAHAFPNRHPFQRMDLAFGDGLPVLMTERDAVKCRRFAESQHWHLPIH